MNITEYTLTISDGEREKSLTYRGNENIVIRSSMIENEDNTAMLFPRHVLEKFMELIQCS
jgi:hypothetical protein